MVNLGTCVLSTSEVTFVPVSQVNGQAEVDDILAAVRPTTCLVTIMLANNETGVVMVSQPVSFLGKFQWREGVGANGVFLHLGLAHSFIPQLSVLLDCSLFSLRCPRATYSAVCLPLQPVPEISQRIRAVNQRRAASGLPPILVHTDAAQALGKRRVDVEDLGVDFLTIVGHKVWLEGHPPFWGRFPVGLEAHARQSPQCYGLFPCCGEQLMVSVLRDFKKGVPSAAKMTSGKCHDKNDRYPSLWEQGQGSEALGRTGGGGFSRGGCLLQGSRCGVLISPRVGLPSSAVRLETLQPSLMWVKCGSCPWRFLSAFLSLRWSVGSSSQGRPWAWLVFAACAVCSTVSSSAPGSACAASHGTVKPGTSHLETWDQVRGKARGHLQFQSLASFYKVWHEVQGGPPAFQAGALPCNPGHGRSGGSTAEGHQEAPGQCRQSAASEHRAQGARPGLVTE